MSITARGGYQIVDFKNNVLTPGSTAEVIIPGAYESAINTNKPLCLTNLGLKLGDNILTPEPFWSCGHSLFENEDGKGIAIIAIIGGRGYVIRIYEDGLVLVATLG